MTDVQARHPEIIQGTTASTVTPPRSRFRPQGQLHGWGRAAYLFVLIVAVVIFVYPLVWLVSASLKPKEQVFDNRLWPYEIRLQNFVDVVPSTGTVYDILCQTFVLTAVNLYIVGGRREIIS